MKGVIDSLEFAEVKKQTEKDDEAIAYLQDLESRWTKFYDKRIEQAQGEEMGQIAEELRVQKKYCIDAFDSVKSRIHKARAWNL